jgi:Putative peptidoglycan binding domain
MIYKFISILIFFTTTLYAQKQRPSQIFVFEVQHPNKQISLDTLYNWSNGWKYARYVYPDQYEFDKNVPLDSVQFRKRPQWKFQYAPPVYDSIVDEMEIRPAYSFYEVDPKAKLPPTAKIIHPVWNAVVSKDTFNKEHQFRLMQYLNVESDKGFVPADAAVFAIVEDHDLVRYKTYQCVLKTPAVLIQNKDNQMITDTLNSTSEYLKWTHVPARTVVRKRYILQKRPRFILSRTSNDTTPIRGATLVRQGGSDDWMQYITCGVVGNGFGIRPLQHALNVRGYRVKANNIFDAQTKKALIRFQKDNDLPIGNLDMKTQKLLGIQLEAGDSNNQPQPQYRNVFKTTHFEHSRKHDFKDAFQMTFLTDIELAELMSESVENVQYFRKFKKLKL